MALTRSKEKEIDLAFLMRTAAFSADSRFRIRQYSFQGTKSYVLEQSGTGGSWRANTEYQLPLALGELLWSKWKMVPDYPGSSFTKPGPFLSAKGILKLLDHLKGVDARITQLRAEAEATNDARRKASATYDITTAANRLVATVERYAAQPTNLTLEQKLALRELARAFPVPEITNG
jgi:hypothetical protein